MGVVNDVENVGGEERKGMTPTCVDTEYEALGELKAADNGTLQVDSEKTTNLAVVGTILEDTDDLETTRLKSSPEDTKVHPVEGEGEAAVSEHANDEEREKEFFKAVAQNAKEKERTNAEAARRRIAMMSHEEKAAHEQQELAKVEHDRRQAKLFKSLAKTSGKVKKPLARKSVLVGGRGRMRRGRGRGRNSFVL
jgi:hypothetical protein